MATNSALEMGMGAGAVVDSQPGVLVYEWRDENTLVGLFALPNIHAGGLALEVAKRTAGEPGEFAGTYDVQTFLGQKENLDELFGDGTITFTPLKGHDGSSNGVYDIVWDLTPVPAWQAILGYRDGTKLIYKAVARSFGGGKYAALAWSNALCERVWEAPG